VNRLAQTATGIIAAASIVLGAVACTDTPGPGPGDDVVGEPTATAPVVPVPVTPTQPTAEAPNAGGAGTEIPAGFEHWYQQVVGWEPCEDGAAGWQCAVIAAPLSWADPDAGSIDLALRMHAATGSKIGTLLTNPGGPGGSGVSFIADSYSGFGAPVREHFDVLGFDPRGVGASSPVRCFDDAQKDYFLSRDFPDGAAGREAMKAANAEWGAACAANTGPLFGQIDTQSAARDMDLIRHLVGDQLLYYLGFSYGTLLGATYAALFPDHVGRLVLDGAIDVTLGFDESSLAQAIGFENALRSYVADCQSGPNCPLTGSVDEGMAQISDLLTRAYENPLPTSGNRRLTRTLATYGVVITLYDNAAWPLLTQALSQAILQGNGDILLFLADFYNDRNDDGTFATNSTEAFIGVSCLDDRGTTDPAEMDRNNEILMEAAPTVGFFFRDGGLSCWDWPYPVAERDFDIHAPGTPPILVIGTTGDPATPYEQAIALADTLDNGVLLTYVGEGHVAYMRSNACIMDTVDAFLVSGVVPPDGKEC